MAGSFETVEDYIAAQPEGVRAMLERVRNAIRKALPGAEETISYKMPTYKLNGKAVLHFAAWKEHYSIYAATARVVETFRAELAPYKIEKGTIRFAFAQPVPVKLIARIAKFRAGEPSEPDS
jgi:uncharacterized protein YdhG (YjbR/CyaY superfamily)